MILYGASGHGKVIIDILESMHEPAIEIWDDADKDPVWEFRCVSRCCLLMVLKIE